jgi:hypothetical protein
MSLTLVIAALLIGAIGIAHSYLGERYIIVPLIRGGRLPRLRFGDAFTAGTVRGAWHITSVAWWGLATVLLHMAFAGNRDAWIATLIAVTFGVTAAMMLVLTRGKHLSWIIFAAIAALTSMGARI